jgi:hypothetical protein
VDPTWDRGEIPRFNAVALKDKAKSQVEIDVALASFD